MTEPGDAPKAESPAQPDAAAAREQRHSRLEALAKELTAGVGGAAPGSRSISMPVLAAAGAVVVLALGWLLWPASEAPRERVAAQQSDETLARLQQRLAERERMRKAQERSGGDYLARSAAADSALLADLTSRAERLAAALDAPKARAPQAKAAPASPKPTPAPAQTAAAAPAPTPAPKSEPKAEPVAPASTPPAQVATAAPPQPAPAAPAPEEECRIHVSELSSSGKLTYDDIARMKGARVDERTHHAFTPPVQVKGRSVVFDVSPSGCVTVAHSFGR